MVYAKILNHIHAYFDTSGRQSVPMYQQYCRWCDHWTRPLQLPYASFCWSCSLFICIQQGTNPFKYHFSCTEYHFSSSTKTASFQTPDGKVSWGEYFIFCYYHVFTSLQHCNYSITPVPAAARSWRRSAAARMLGLRVRIPAGAWCLSPVIVVCCQIEVSATSWSLVQRSAIDCGASLCVIYKTQEWGGHGPR